MGGDSRWGPKRRGGGLASSLCRPVFSPPLLARPPSLLVVLREPPRRTPPLLSPHKLIIPHPTSLLALYVTHTPFPENDQFLFHSGQRRCGVARRTIWRGENPPRRNVRHRREIWVQNRRHRSQQRVRQPPPWNSFGNAGVNVCQERTFMAYCVDLYAYPIAISFYLSPSPGTTSSKTINPLTI